MVVRRRARKASPKRRVIGYQGRGTVEIVSRTSAGVKRAATRARKAVPVKSEKTTGGFVSVSNIKPIYGR